MMPDPRQRGSFQQHDKCSLESAHCSLGLMSQEKLQRVVEGPSSMLVEGPTVL